MFSVQQKTAATNIRRTFLEKRLRYAILKSQCQAGKTGAYHALINMMLNAEDGALERAYILCGSHETELRRQAMKDAKKHNRDAWAEGKIEVLFRQDFEDATMNIQNAIIIVDESHLDQGKGQQLDKFLLRHGLSLDGNPATLIAKNAFIVSVDATPYSEIAALVHKETPYEKHMEELQPGESYIGIGHYHYSGLLHGTFDISQNKKRFASLFPSHVSKYALLRISSAQKGKPNAQEVAVEKLAQKKGWQVLYYTADQTDIAMTRSEQRNLAKKGKEVQCLEDAPEVHTIVIIRGRLRAGKVVPKKHIAFVWEGAANSKTDSLVQGLAGRMCGYRQDPDAEEDPTKLDGDNLPHLFVPPSALERHEKKVVKSSEIERAILTPDLLPTKATNLRVPHVDSVPSNGRTACVPLRLVREESEEWVEEADGETGRDAASATATNILDEFKAKLLTGINTSSAYTPEQKAEIQEMVESRTVFIRRITADKAESHKQALAHVINAYKTQTAAPNHVVKKHEGITFFVIGDGLSVAGAKARHVYAVFYTKADASVGWIKTVNLKSRVPETNGKSIFSFSDRATDVPLAAAGATGFSEEKHLKTPKDFEHALFSYLTHWSTSSLTVTREIKSAKDRFALDKCKFHYKSSKDNDVLRICAGLSETFSVNMKVKFARSSEGTRGHFNVKSISW
jgi:hypothetical protein